MGTIIGGMRPSNVRKYILVGRHSAYTLKLLMQKINPEYIYGHVQVGDLIKF
jgi:hypothetical protein